MSGGSGAPGWARGARPSAGFGGPAHTQAAPGRARHTAAPSPPGSASCKQRGPQSGSLRLEQAAPRSVSRFCLLTMRRPPGPVGGPSGLISEHKERVSAAVLTGATGITQSAVQKARGYKYPHDSCKSLPDGFSCFAV